jgi:cytosine/adenosine deaminase-related metal-dependent hydrolase
MILLRARVVLPVGRPAIPNGAVGIARNRIAAVGRWRELSRRPHERTLDLGDVALLPGLVNAHCHLDYTAMAGHFPPPKVFTDWLKLIVEAKSGWDLRDYQESWSSGARMLVRTGTTTVGDIEAVPDLLPKAWQETPLRILSFLEMIGITPRRLPSAVLHEALDKLRALKHPRCRAGLSPHAPYSTTPELLRLTGVIARRRRWRVCAHVAESALEFEMFAHARGEMHAWIGKSGRDLSDCGRGTPVRHLARNGLLGENVLATHVNYLGRGDAALLAKSGTHVVHCPRSHHYFRHGPFALRALQRAGVNVCLGTDSLASVVKGKRQTVELSLFDEMRALAAREPALAPRTIVRMATINGARALGLAGGAGELTEGAYADIIAVPLAPETKDVWSAVVHHHGHVTASLIDGHWAVAPAEVQAEFPHPWP